MTYQDDLEYKSMWVSEEAMTNGGNDRSMSLAFESSESIQPISNDFWNRLVVFQPVERWMTTNIEENSYN